MMVVRGKTMKVWLSFFILMPGTLIGMYEKEQLFPMLTKMFRVSAAEYFMQALDSLEDAKQHIHCLLTGTNEHDDVDLEMYLREVRFQTNIVQITVKELGSCLEEFKQERVKRRASWPLAKIEH